MFKKIDKKKPFFKIEKNNDDENLKIETKQQQIESNIKNETLNSEIKSKEKIKKKKEIWDNKHYKLKNIGYPETIDPKYNLNKKFKIKIEYKDQNDKLRKKTIRFGKKNDIEYLESRDLNRKNKLSSKLGNTHNLFHGNYWRWHLLNGDGDMKSNWISLINDIK